MKKKGFTLIELLVTISIIGLLSSVVLASLQTARAKAVVTKKNSLAKEYVNALSIAYTDATGFPFDPLDDGGIFCLGADNPGDSCHDLLTTRIENSTINAELSPFIPGPPASNDPVILSTTDYRGITYYCNELIDSRCTNFVMTWFFDPTVTTCGPGIYTHITSPVSITQCMYVSSN